MPTNESGLAEQFDDPGQQLRADVMGMWAFLATEMLLFGSLLASFVILRSQHADVFAEAARHLNLALGAANTGILLTSGLTVAMSEQAVNNNRRRTALWLLAIGILLGVIFLGIKGYEWHRESTENLMPLLGLPFHFPGPHEGIAELYFDLYYLMTGMHALHMIIGLGALLVMLVQVARWAEPARLGRQVRLTGLYWHFVDVVWIFIFTLLYLLRS